MRAARLRLPSRRLARALVLAAGLLVVLQGFATAWLAARGPLHRHAAALVLEDVRRAGPGRLDAARFEALAAPRAHAHADGERHHHAPDGAWVPLDDAVAAADAAAPDDGTPAQAPFLPWRTDRPPLAAAAVPADAAPAAEAPGWRSRSTVPPLRPPRAA